MKLNEFDYQLPEELIAQQPIEPRDASRLMVVDCRQDLQVFHEQFFHLPKYLSSGDVLVINNTRVMPARILAVRPDTGSQVEFLLLKNVGKDTWEVLARPGKRAVVGRVFDVSGQMKAEVTGVTETGERLVRFHYDGDFFDILDQIGQTPLPPYIKEELADRERYQTVYAKDSGSAAAPTAGLHFTQSLLSKIEAMGVHFAPVTLHVGLGTFRPVTVDQIEEHKMHAEYFVLPESSAEIINHARRQGKRIFAVGTTSVRVLETLADAEGQIKAGSGWTDIFIYPGYRFKITDALITNFHLPKSSLLMLVSAFVGIDVVRQVYDTAVKKRYRFFSFGDACLFLRK